MDASSHHPYSKFIHAENQDILWSLFQKSRPLVFTQTQENQEAVFKRNMREYYTEHLISSGKPCVTVRDLFVINRDALAHLLSHEPASYGGTIRGIDVSEEKKRMDDMQRNKFNTYSSEYHQMLARPSPKSLMSSSVPTDDKIKNMDELMELQIQARKEDERRIAAIMKPVKTTPSLKIDFGADKSVSWDPVIEVVEI